MSTSVDIRPCPVAVCMRCSRPHDEESFEMTAICLYREPDGSVCGGRVTWRPDPEDWELCGDCGATGLIDQQACPRCRAAGWILKLRS